MRRRLVCAVALVFVTVAAVANSGKPTPVFVQDLHAFGFLTQAKPETASYTDVVFLTDETVLVTINQTVFTGPVVYPFEDQPPAKLLLFDISQRKLTRTAEFPIEKMMPSVRATQNGEFVLLNEAGVHHCSASLECDKQVPSRGPIRVSPKGTRLIVGGNGRTEQKLLDSATFNELDRFPAGHDPEVVPGDAALLLWSWHDLRVRSAGHPDQSIPLGRDGFPPEARFLNDHTIAGFEFNTALSVATVGGKILYSVPVQTRWNLARLVSSPSGARFCFHEGGYTRWNSVVNFLDIDSGRPLNLERVTVFDTDSGRVVLKMQWDPRPYQGDLTDPALSPDGHKLAIIRKGRLEAFDIP
jgi:hypothetical protein